MDDNLKKGRLDSIIALKGEYQIGSREALAYLQSQDFYARVQHNLARYFRRGSYRPSLRELANFSDTTNKGVRHALFVIANKHAFSRRDRLTPFDLLDTLGGSEAAFSVLEYNPTLRAEYLRQYSGEGQALVQELFPPWSFDYLHFFLDYYHAVNQGKSQKEAFRSAVTSFVSTDHPYLSQDIHTLDFAQFRALRGYPGNQQMDISFIIDCVMREVEEERWSERNLEEGLPIETGFYLDRFPPEEEIFLYGLYPTIKIPYERGLEEHILKRLDVERRIALNELLNYYPGATTEKLIDLVISELAGEATFLELKTEIRERRQYILNAIKKNKKWLIKVFNN